MPLREILNRSFGKTEDFKWFEVLGKYQYMELDLNEIVLKNVSVLLNWINKFISYGRFYKIFGNSTKGPSSPPLVEKKFYCLKMIYMSLKEFCMI